MARCEATVTIHDDRWGAFIDRCELDAEHDGDHRVPRAACDPPAYLGWSPLAEGNDDDRT